MRIRAVAFSVSCFSAMCGEPSPDIVARPDVPFFRLPPGFAVNEFAGGFKYPRWLAVAPNGDVFLTLPLSGKVVLLRDGNGDGRAELTSAFAAGFKRPHGLAFHDGYLYVADVNRVWRLAWRADETKAQGAPKDGLQQWALPCKRTRPSSGRQG